MPLLFAGSILLATAFASVYIERLLLDLNRADNEISIDPGTAGRLTAATGPRQMPATAADTTIDDSAWRPPTS